jgi:hypothetical protein
VTKVKLYEERGRTSRFIDAEIDEAGDLILSAQDVGEVPRKYWGDGDYEFWVLVKGEHKDRLLLALIEQLYGGRAFAVDDTRELLRAKGIPHEFGSWV